MKKRISIIYFLVMLFAGVFIFYGTSCSKGIEDVSFYDKSQVTILTYLKENPEYSGFLELSEKSGYSGALGAYGSYTVFVFDNDALQAYKSSVNITEFDNETAKRLIEYHILRSVVNTDIMGNGGLKTSTIAGDYIVADLQEGNKIMLNNHSLVKTRDLVMTNGYMHVIDKVLPPINDDVKSRIFKEAGFSIFKAMWENSDFETAYAKEKGLLTFFVVPDSVYKKAGINSLTDIMNLSAVNNERSKLTDFVAYHAIQGMRFLNFFDGGNYPTLGKEMLSVKIENRYKVNKRFIKTPEDTEVETFVPVHPDMSNKQAINGVYHVLGNILIPITPPAEYAYFDFTEQPELVNLPEYGVRSISGIENWEFERAKVVVTGGRFDYFVSSHWEDRIYYHNKDIFNFTGGRWSLELISPKISAGKYRMRLLYKVGSARAAVQVYLDDVKVGDPVNMRNNYPTDKDVVKSRNYWRAFVKDVYFDVTKEHVIRIQTVVPGQGLLDGMEFEPINE